MRTSMIVLAALTFGIAGAAVAQTTGGVEAYQPNSDMLTARLGNITIGHTDYGEQNMLLAGMNEKNFRNSNDSMEQSPAGGMATAGSAGGVGN